MDSIKTDPTPAAMLESLARDLRELATSMGALIDGLTEHAAGAQLVRGKLLSIANEAQELAPRFPGAKP
jgi:hypothetical protein